MRFARFMLPLLFCVAAQAAEVPPHNEAKANLTILADESLLLPVAQLARAYATATGTPLTVVVKNSTEAEQQIEQGLEAHIVLTANHPLVERLAAQGLTDVSGTKPIARSPIALVAASDSDKQGLLAKHISFAAMLYATPGVPIYIDAPETNEGARAAALMKGFEFSTPLAQRAVAMPDREQVLEAIQENHAMGLVLAAVASGEPDLVVVSVLPENVSEPVTFEAVVLASESMKEARQFTTYLQTRPAQAIFSHFGFQSPAAIK